MEELNYKKMKRKLRDGFFQNTDDMTVIGLPERIEYIEVRYITDGGVMVTKRYNQTVGDDLIAFHEELGYGFGREMKKAA